MSTKNSKPKVSISKGSDAYQRTLSALHLLNEINVSAQSKVLVKFNLAPFFQFSQNSQTSQIDPCRVSTSVTVVKAVLDFLRECGAKNITVAEGPCAFGISEDAMFGFKACGYQELCRDLGCELVDLDKDEVVDVEIPDALCLKRIKIARTALESDFIVSVPVMRTHALSTISLSMKNLMGCISLKHKGEMHPDNDRSSFHERLSDLSKLLKPSLSVIDGSGCADKSTHKDGSLPQLDLTIAGNDMVAVDSVGAAVMGVPWIWIPWLVVAHREGLGVANLDDIEVVGKGVDEVHYRVELER